jgi:branched-chain amino acid transport system substrate-binding protein
MVNHVVKQMKAKAPAILGDSGGTSRDGIANLHKMLGDNGIKPVGVQEFTTNAEDVTPQLLSLRRANPDVLMLFSGVPQDVRRVLTNLSEMNWDVKVVSGTPLTAYAPGLLRAMPQGAFKNVMGEASDGATYCANDALWSKPWSKFIRDLTASAPDVVPKMPTSPAAFTYTATYIIKAAMEASGSTDGAKAAAWIEGNVGSVKNIITDTKFVASKTSHFLLAPESVVMVENPHLIREDGLSQRAGC